MNHALLTELQQLTAYPSITVLLTTRPGSALTPADQAGIHDLVEEADDRLTALVDDELRARLVDTLLRQATAAARGRATNGLAICVSPEHEAVIRLGRTVESRVVIADTFATRDLVADANRTATYRVVCVSDQQVRLMVGDRARLVEIHDSTWPLQRHDDDGRQVWRRRIAEVLRRECTSFEIPSIVAGVGSTVRGLLDDSILAPIGSIPGNHDRTNIRTLREAAIPLLEEWLDGDTHRALSRLESARGARIFAGGLDEVWDLAHDGRVELLVVEDDYRRAARVAGPHLEIADHEEGPEVIPDAVDDLIETVLQSGGETVMVPPGELRQHDHLAAVLRY